MIKANLEQAASDLLAVELKNGFGAKDRAVEKMLDTYDIGEEAAVWYVDLAFAEYVRAYSKDW